ncbi:hypothetical protein AAFO92_17540 [Roseovarius sp. CAU 1744]|uniref:hypothetical protein n=1 Tax=Roseovarius sp. CAU 1744 TaxID=3140368 RepID=UPI00325BFF93
MKALVFILLMLAGAALAQTREVNPEDLSLTVTIEQGNTTPYRQEMVLLTIHGVYRRHITLEDLEQPDLSGFNWMQLGQDHWYESRLNGKTVKNFKRRMALYPDQSGTLTIGPFVHHLTLTDEGDDWFAHDVRSAPITLQVAPEPAGSDWWFPVRRLGIDDQWSNAPDQLGDGEGVLRVIRVTAVGVAPEMIPPMPELKSPSAMIFAHPEKRLVELSPQGPVSVAFWRWTVRPTNGASAILEPLTFDYFDTQTRKSHQVTISAQRIAMKEIPAAAPGLQPPQETRLRPAMLAGAGLAALLAGLAAMLSGRRLGGVSHVFFDPSRRALRRAARAGELPALRRAAAQLMRQEGVDGTRAELLQELDNAIFGRVPARNFDPRQFARRFLARQRDRKPPGLPSPPTKKQP